MARVPAFSESLAAVRTPSELIAAPLDRFVALEPASARPAPVDTALTFARQPLGTAAPDPALLTLDSSRPGVVTGRELGRAAPGPVPHDQWAG